MIDEGGGGESMPPPATIVDDARAKLRAKLKEKRAQRTGQGSTTTAPTRHTQAVAQDMMMQSEDPAVMQLIQQVVKTPSSVSSLLHKVRSGEQTRPEEHAVTAEDSNDEDDEAEEGLPPFARESEQSSSGKT